MISHHWGMIFSGTVPKDFSYPESNEDKLRFCETQRVYILSDGASESFNSGLWAEILVDLAVSELPSKGYARWLTKAIRKYTDQSDIMSMSWSQEASFNRGSFASLLVAVLAETQILLTAIGDSTAILIEDGSITNAFPYTSSPEFLRRPQLLSTIRKHNTTRYFQDTLRGLVRSDVNSHCKAVWDYPSSDNSYLVCVTDALGEWILRDDEHALKRIHDLTSIRNQDDLLSLVDTARREDALRKDDSSLILLGSPR